MEQARANITWMDFVWLTFLAGLAVLYPIREIHKQMVLVGIGIFQLVEHQVIARLGSKRGQIVSVLVKIALSWLLVDHTGGIFSSYYLIYFLPVASAGTFFGPFLTLLWTAVASATYCSFLIPAWKYYYLTSEGATELAIRVLFFFLAAIIVNRLAEDSKRQAERYRVLAETLATTNERLERAEAEARRSERLAALGQLSAGLAHEIRNPLAVISASAEMLTKTLEPAEALAREMAGYISSEVERLNLLVSRFLNFARPLDLKRTPEQIPPLLDRALKSMEERWPDRKVEIERQYDENLPVAPVDPGLMEQVFSNLIQNAYEAIGESGGKLRVSASASQSAEQPGVEIEIEDTGPGIADDLREQIFNPFFTTKPTGVGLGLSIVSKIIDAHGGSIRVCGEPGKGACFRVFLPA